MLLLLLCRAVKVRVWVLGLGSGVGSGSGVGVGVGVGEETRGRKVKKDNGGNIALLTFKYVFKERRMRTSGGAMKTERDKECAFFYTLPTFKDVKLVSTRQKHSTKSLLVNCLRLYIPHFATLRYKCRYCSVVANTHGPHGGRRDGRFPPGNRSGTSRGTSPTSQSHLHCVSDLSCIVVGLTVLQ